jgi:hypothetical protein
MVKTKMGNTTVYLCSVCDKRIGYLGNQRIEAIDYPYTCYWCNQKDAIQPFPRYWVKELGPFDFVVVDSKGSNTSLFRFLTRQYAQAHCNRANRNEEYYANQTP